MLPVHHMHQVRYMHQHLCTSLPPGLGSCMRSPGWRVQEEIMP